MVLPPKGGSASGEGGLPNFPVLTSSGGHCSGRYASYWNAFLFNNIFGQNVCNYIGVRFPMLIQ